MNVLIVEDEEPISNLIRDVLETYGHACLIARSVEEAEEILATRTVSAMTLDHVLPGTHGIDWLDNLAGSRPDLVARTLVVSGSELHPSHHEILNRLGVSFLPKPFLVHDLLASIRALENR